MTYANKDPNGNDDPNQKSKWGKKLSAKSGSDGPSPFLIAFIVIAVLALIFILQNQNQVNTHFLFFSTRSKVWSSLFVAMLIGVALDRLFGMWWRRRKSRKDDKTDVERT